MKKALLLGLFFIQSASAAPADLADNFVGTLYANFQKSSVAGDLKGCGFDFSVVGRDTTTRKPSFYRATGSLMLRADTGSVTLLLKLGVQDMDWTTLKYGSLWPPATAYISAKNGTPAKQAIRIPSDNPGFMMFAYPLTADALKAFEELLETGTIEIGFNRTKQSQDLISVIDARVLDTKAQGDEVVRTKSNEVIESIGACAIQLIRKAEQHLDVQSEPSR